MVAQATVVCFFGMYPSQQLESDMFYYTCERLIQVGVSGLGYDEKQL